MAHDAHQDPRDPPIGPYAAAAFGYLRAGWAPLPLPYGQKKTVPDGWTGNDGAWPSGADVQAWTEDRGGGNVALRMPPHVLGIDVDDYRDKPGGAVLDDLQAKHGPLPATWSSSSRAGRSGIRFYRVPQGLLWPGILGPGIEIIRYGHRYAVAWPSVHPEGGTYRWTRPDGAIALEELPEVDELPALPETWVKALTNGVLAGDQPKADLDDADAAAWLTARSSAPVCRVMQKVVDGGLADLGAGGSRHEAALGLTNRIAWLAGEGHTGANEALDAARRAFAAATVDRSEPGEFSRMVAGAVRLSAAAHADTRPDPCLDPFAALVNKEHVWPTTTSSFPLSSDSSRLPSDKPTSSSVSPNGSASAATVTTTSPTTAPADATSRPAAAAPGSELNQLPSSQPGELHELERTQGPLLEQIEQERTSWWPRDTEAALDPDAAEPPPAFLRRDDGQALFYPGRVNGLIAPSESGKTWLALECIRQVVEDGGRATVVDFEDTQRGIVGRLLSLGLTEDQIRRQVSYIGPDEPLSLNFATGRDLYEHLDTFGPSLIIVDGVNAGMTMHGLDLISNKDATLFAQLVLKPMTRNGACVVYVDHTPKNKEDGSAGGIGAQAKRAMTTGCAIRVTVRKAFGKGQNGTLTLNIDKDRQGDVRGASLPSGEGGHWAGTAQIVSTEDGAVSIVIESPGTRIEQRNDNPTFRPTVYMSRVSEYVAENPGMGRNLIVGVVRGTDRHIKTALDVLVAEGWIRVEKDGQKSLHYSVKPYTEVADLVADAPGSTGGGTGGGLGAPPPAKNRGRLGADEQDEVLRPAAPGSGSDAPTEGGRRAAPSGKTVTRVVAGREVQVNLETGEVVELEGSKP